MANSTLLSSLYFVSKSANEVLKQLPVSSQFVGYENCQPMDHQPKETAAVFVSLRKLRCSNPDVSPPRKL